MTHGDLAAYWGAVAQIIPVLALAFVIEARSMVLRMSKKRAYKRRGQRIRTSVLFFVLGLLLILSEYAALQSLSSAPDSKLRSVESFYYWGSFVAVAASLTLVVWFPISEMVSASTGDVIRWIEVHVPWGKAQRLRRLIVRQLADVERAIREAKSTRLDALLMSAMVLLQENLNLEFIRKALVAALSSHKHIEFIDPTGELRELANSDPHKELWGYRVSRLFYDGLVSRHREMRKLRKSLRSQIRRIDKVTDVNSPEFVKIQRANMAAAAKIP